MTLSLGPILLLPIGGAMGGAFGAAGLFIKLSLGHKPFNTPFKGLAVLASYLGYILVAGLLYNLING
ncbi:hypothetical protein [Streptomyces sp. NPDC127112]|uniref:hypothetical protein n=1 Tax=Streptomyces sp. NPDC127112 TaxID=3345364 RepID=UPI003644F46C